MDKKKKFEILEKMVVEKILSGDDRVLDILRKQYNDSVVESREFTGAGFYTTFKINDSAPMLVGKNSFQLGDVIGTIKGVKYGVGFVLFIKDGKIDFLEGYTYGEEKWPENIEDFRLSFTSNDIRDIQKLKKICGEIKT